jgi:hypothetical protein
VRVTGMEPEYLYLQGWTWISEAAYRRGLCKICINKILVTKYAIEILELYERRLNEIIHRMEIHHLTEPVLILDFSMGMIHLPAMVVHQPKRGGASLIKLMGTLTSKQGPIISYNIQFKKEVIQEIMAFVNITVVPAPIPETLNSD